MSKDTIGGLTKRNGAWLVSIHDPEGDSTPDETIDCAASVTVGKRIARQIAERLGWGGKFTWVEGSPGQSWELHATRYTDSYGNEGWPW